MRTAGQHECDEAANEMLLRLVHNTHGPRDGRTGEGFPVWAVDVGGEARHLTIAEFEDITVVRMARVEAPAVVSLR